MLGNIIGSYKLADLIGHGSMGEVYLGEHLLFPRKAAIKCVRPDRANKTSTIDRMIREATAASAVDHPAIITVYEAGRLPQGGIYLALEYVEGKTLSQRLKEDGTMSPADVISFGRQISEGLSELHSRDVLHRDLKPANLMVTPRNQIKILDFGIALLRQDVRLTASEGIVGTPAFMSPEQIRGNELDGRSDLFSLGAVLYQCLVGSLPFSGSSFESVMLKILHDDPPPIKLGETYAELLEIIDHLLQKDPKDRPQDAQAVSQRLRNLERMEHRSSDGTDSSISGIELDQSGNLDGSKIIVYPFTNVGASSERAYFGDGLAEALTTALSQHQEFKVVAAAAVRTLNRKGTAPLDAAKRLGAGRVCVGTATWIGDRVRVTGQLLTAKDGGVLWSQQEDGSEIHLFEIQDKFSKGLIQALRGIEASPSPVTEAGTADTALDAKAGSLKPEALRAYQRGVAFLDDTSGFAIRRAEESFRHVLEIDPNFVPARAQLALSILKRFLRFERKPELIQAASQEARLAQKADPRSSVALAVLALCESLQGEYERAKERVSQAIAGDPNLAFAHLVRAHASGFSGDLEACREASVAAVSRDPLDPFILHFASLLISEVPGEHERAIEWVQRSARLAPDYFGSAAKLGDIYMLAMQSQKAATAFEHALARMPAGETGGHNMAMAWDGLAWAQIGLSKFAEAKRSAELALDAGGKGAPVVAHKNLTFALLALDDPTGAKKAGEIAAAEALSYLQINPLDPQYWFGLGEIYLGHGKFEEGAEAFEKAVSISTSHISLGGLARIHALLGNQERAESYVKLLSDQFPLSPQTPFSNYVVADLLDLPGKSAHLRQARSLGFDSEGWITVFHKARKFFG
ncbi:MAG: protein kinase [Candidatus Eisenbacteria bacterium]|uniref:Protein kinase n=1 Tax=Eiseniibacteriota bacterium TaxID=2212470 RepID=A0A7Y2EEM2_UNCEI|nr:protein kinase [Candidatus Eisenbacteria bacterium]